MTLGDPFELASLAEPIGALAEMAQRRFASARPEVVRHLFLEGWLNVHRQYARGGPAPAPDKDQALLGLWSLMLESVTCGWFGVSTSAWRTHQTYPELYFLRLWLDVAPAVAKHQSPRELLTLSAQAFNLGERLNRTDRRLANRVSEALVANASHLSLSRFHSVVREILSEPGGPLFVAATGPTLASLGRMDLDAGFPSFVPSEVSVDDEGFFLIDWHVDSSVRILLTDDVPRLGALDPFAYFERQPSLRASTSRGTLFYRGHALWLETKPGHEQNILVRQDGFPVSLACRDDVVVIVEANSRWVDVYRLFG